MSSDEAVERVERFADSLDVNRHYMTGQTCREVQADIRVLLTLSRQPPPQSGEASEAMVERIGALLAADPICGGRVAQGTIEAIAALHPTEVKAKLDTQS